MEKEKDRAAYWLRAFLWLILFIIFGILDGFVQEKFPEFLLPHYLFTALCIGSWIVFAYYCIQFKKLNKFIILFEIKFKSKR